MSWNQAPEDEGPGNESNVSFQRHAAPPCLDLSNRKAAPDCFNVFRFPTCGEDSKSLSALRVQSLRFIKLAHAEFAPSGALPLQFFQNGWLPSGLMMMGIEAEQTSLALLA